MASRAASRTLTDHDEIRQWAEERNARPSCVKETGSGDDTGVLRLDFPGYSGEESLEEISWDEFFDKFDENNLALLVQHKTASGERSNFNKLVSRQTARQAGNGNRRSSGSARGRSSRGGTRSSSSSSRSSRTSRSSSSRGGSRSSGTRRSRGTSTSRNSRSASGSRSSRTNATSKKRASRSSGSSSSRRRAA
jgi:hypothetical protein